MTPTGMTNAIVGWTQEYSSDQERGPRFRSFVAELDGADRVLRETDWGQDGKLLSDRLFAPPGRLSEERRYRPDGTLEHRNVFHYDAAGRKTETVMYTGDGKIYGKWTSHYDDAGKLQRETWWNRRGEVEVEDRYEYPDDGRTVVKSRGSVAGWTSTNDANGKLLAMRGGYYSADQADDSTFEYDAQGRLTKKTEFSSPGVVRRITEYSLE